MTDYIKRDDVIKAVVKVFTDTPICPPFALQSETIRLIKALPSADAVDVAHDIPEYCSWSQTYTNMVQGFRGGKIPPKEMLDGTVLIPQHQWLEMERELAELKEKFKSADTVSREFYEDAVKANIGLVIENRKLKEQIESADAVQGEWIPCSERLPSEDEIVNITWVNHNPPPYYADIEGKPFVASGLRYRDKWYWYSSVCQDLHQDFDIIDKDIEVVAWMPLPKPYKGGDDE